MTLLDAINSLTLTKVFSMEGSDWSWYYQLGADEHANIIVVNHENKEASFTYLDMVENAWIVRNKKDLKLK